MKFTYLLLTLLLCAGFVSCSEDDDNVIKSSEKKITEFSVNGLKAEIDEAQKTIALVLPAETDLTKLKPLIKISDKASIDPAAETETDFSHPVVYTVTAQDGSKQEYTATLTVEAKKIPFLLSKIGISIDDQSGNVIFTYNEDNTLAKYLLTTDGVNEIMSYTFAYDDQKRLTQVKMYEDKELHKTYTYTHKDNNKVEMLKETVGMDAEMPNNPLIYTLNDKGFPVKMEQKGYTYFVEKEDGGGYGGSGPNRTKTYEYNADNTLNKIDSEDFHEFFETPYTTYETYTFEYDADTNHPLQNLPAGNIFLYENMLLELSLTITGNGAFAGNCTMYNLKTEYNEQFEYFSTVYEYGEHKFPVKAQVKSIIEDDDTYTYDLTFEYIMK